MSQHAGVWYTNPEFLERMGRDSMVHFFAAFAADIHAVTFTLPDPELPDDRYFAEAARLLEVLRRRVWLSPQRLPVCRRVPRLSLEPLRALGPDALNVAGHPGIVKITLCEIKTTCSNGHCQTHTTQSDDLFDVPHSQAVHHPAIPRAGRLARATFRILFADSTTPRPVVLCPPQTLQLVQESDAEPVMCWLVRRGFQIE